MTATAPAWTKTEPFHVVRHGVESDGKRVTERFSIYVKNRPLLKRPVPMSRREAMRTARSLNRSRRCLKWAETIRFSRGGVV